MVRRDDLLRASHNRASLNCGGSIVKSRKEVCLLLQMEEHGLYTCNKLPIYLGTDPEIFWGFKYNCVVFRGETGGHMPVLHAQSANMTVTAQHRFAFNISEISAGGWASTEPLHCVPGSGLYGAASCRCLSCPLLLSRCRHQ